VDIDPIIKEVAPGFTEYWDIGTLIGDVSNLKGQDTLIKKFLKYYYTLLRQNAFDVPDDILTYDFGNNHKQFMRVDLEHSCVCFSQIEGEVIVIGDIHGDWISFLKVLFDADIINKLRKGKLGQFILLGDYIDRGECSFEVLVSVFILHALFIDKITLLKGNHENDLKLCNEFPGCIANFLSDKQSLEKIIGKIKAIINLMPYFAYVRDCKKFFVHGGVPVIPVSGFKTLLLSEMNCKSYLWSDPCASITIVTIRENNIGIPGVADSERGAGYYFSEEVMKQLQTDIIIPIKQCVRAHEAFDSFYEANVFKNRSVISLFTTGQGSAHAYSEYKNCRPYYAVYDSLESEIELKALNRKGFMDKFAFLIALKLKSLEKGVTCFSVSYNQFFSYEIQCNGETLLDDIHLPKKIVREIFGDCDQQDKENKTNSTPCMSFNRCHP